MPHLWRMQWKSSLLPVKVFGGQAVAGRQYMARLICASGEYVIFIPEQTGVRLSQAMLEVLVQTTLPVRLGQAMLEVLVYAPIISGQFYVLYDTQDILVVTELSDGGGSAIWKTDWLTTWYDARTYWADYIYPSATEEAKVNVTAGKGNTSYIFHSADGGDNWSSVSSITAWNRFYRGRSDLSTPGLMWAPHMSFPPAPYNVYKVSKSTNGGSGWTSATLGSHSSSWNSVAAPVVCPMRNGSGYYVVYPMINSGAGTYGQQWYKVDGGTSSWWELVTSITYVYPDMAVDPTNPNRIFYVEGNQEIIKLSWSTKAKTNRTPPGTILDITGIVCTSTGVVFAAVRVSSGGDRGRIYWSSDRGKTWSYYDFTSQSDSVWDESMILGITSGDTVAMMLNSGKVLFTSDDGSTWGVTSQLGFDWSTDFATVLDIQGT